MAGEPRTSGARIVVAVRGGLVEAAWTDTPGVELVIVDYDVQDAPIPSGEPDRGLLEPQLDRRRVEREFDAEFEQ